MFLDIFVENLGPTAKYAHFCSKRKKYEIKLLKKISTTSHIARLIYDIKNMILGCRFKNTTS